MASEKMSDERAIQILAWYGERGFIDPATLKPLEKFFIAHENEANAEVREAMRVGAAAIAAQRELVDALAYLVGVTKAQIPMAPNSPENPIDHGLTLLVRFGRVKRDGDGYRWADPC